MVSGRVKAYDLHFRGGGFDFEEAREFCILTELVHRLIISPIPYRPNMSESFRCQDHKNSKLSSHTSIYQLRFVELPELLLLMIPAQHTLNYGMK